MPIVQLKHCTVEGDVAQAFLDMEQHIGDVTRNILDELNTITTPSLDGINSILQQFLISSPTPLSTNELAAQIGIPVLNPTDEDNEMRLTPLGIILIRRIMYLADTSGNISAYRRLYFSVGGDITIFLQIVNGTKPFALIQTYLRVQKLPRTQTWTLVQVQELFKNPAIEAVYLAADGAQYVVIPTFLGVNISSEQAAMDSGVPDNETNQIVNQLFWLKKVNQNPATIADLQTLGITGDYLAAALFGTPVLEVKPDLLPQNEGNVSVETGQAISQLQFLLQRFSQISIQDRFTYRAEGNASTVAAQQYLFQQQQIVRFNATVLARPQDIADFLVKNSVDDLVYLLASRLDVTGINFQATTQDIQRKIIQSIATPSGSTTVSSLQVNNPPPTVPPAIDDSNGSLCRNYCANLLLTVPTAIRYVDIDNAVSCLQQSLLKDPVQTPSPVPIVGYPSWDSPATTLVQQMDFGQTLDQSGLIAAIEKNLAGLGVALVAIIAIIIAMIKTTQAAINLVFNAFKQLVGNFISQVQGMISLFNSFFGTISLNLSILKCTYVLPTLGVSGLDELLAALLSAIDAIQSQLLAALGKAAKAIGDMIAQLLCFIPNLLNNFIAGIPNPVPAICQVNKIELPKDITDALDQLRNGFTVQSVSASAFSRDLLKNISASLKMSKQIEQFKKSTSCDDPSMDSFTNASKKLLKVVTTNPISSLPGVT